MLTYEIDEPASGNMAPDDLWRVEFRGTVSGHDGVLIWINNVYRRDAESLLKRWSSDPEGREVWCRRCPTGPIPRPHEHDSLPEELGWLHSEMTKLRIMPMREAI